jgi:hypothetical protein
LPLLASKVAFVELDDRTSHRITELTRQKIRDLFVTDAIWWAGRLQEDEFLRRIYPIDKMPSYDARYSTATEDIRKHRVYNMDWNHDWIFSDGRFQLSDGNDETLLRFLSEMLHPVVRSNENEVASLLSLLNAVLKPDGYELAPMTLLSGAPVYGWRERTGFHGARPDRLLTNRANLTDPRVLHESLARIQVGLDKDPAAAIGSCKELVESLCKIILMQSGVSDASGEDLPSLYRKVADLLNLSAESVPGSAKGSASAQKILRTLSTTVQTLAELRNELGLGHGREKPSPALTRHARLALNSTVTVCEFLLDTWEERLRTGKLVIDEGPGLVG